MIANAFRIVSLLPPLLVLVGVLALQRSADAAEPQHVTIQEGR